MTGSSVAASTLSSRRGSRPRENLIGAGGDRVEKDLRGMLSRASISRAAPRRSRRQVDTGGGHLVHENVGDGTAVVAGNPSVELVPAARDQSVGKVEVDFLLESADPRSGSSPISARARDHLGRRHGYEVRLGK